MSYLKTLGFGLVALGVLGVACSAKVGDDDLGTSSDAVTFLTFGGGCGSEEMQEGIYAYCELQCPDPNDPFWTARIDGCIEGTGSDGALESVVGFECYCYSEWPPEGPTTPQHDAGPFEMEPEPQPAPPPPGGGG